MSIVAWLALGLLAGLIGSKVVERNGRGVFGDIFVGILGAFVGGALFHLVGATGITGLNLWSLFVAIIGSVMLLVAYHSFQGWRDRHAPR